MPVRRRRPLIERVSRALCRSQGVPEESRFDGAPMWRSFEEEARDVIESSGILAFVGVIRDATRDPAMPRNIRENLLGALAAFEGEAD